MTHSQCSLPNHWTRAEQEFYIEEFELPFGPLTKSGFSVQNGEGSSQGPLDGSGTSATSGSSGGS